jgi:hypothetical protein
MDGDAELSEGGASAGDAEPIFPTETQNTIESSKLPPLGADSPEPDMISAAFVPSPKKTPEPPPKRTPAMKRLTYSEAFARIPLPLLHNPHIARRLNIFPPRPSRPPRAALSSSEYRSQTCRPLELDELTSSILANPDVASDPSIRAEQLRSSSHQLKLLEKELIDKSRYPAAKRAVDALLRCEAELRLKQRGERVLASLAELERQRAGLLELVDGVRRTWDDRISEHDRQVTDSLDRLRTQQAAELESFEAAIPSDLTPLFKRNSVTYLQLRCTEKNLALTRQFDQAQRVKVKADRLAAQEEQQNLERMDLYYQEKKARLQQRHQTMIHNFLSYCESRRSELTAARDGAIAGQLARIALIERQLERIREENPDQLRARPSEGPGPPKDQGDTAEGPKQPHEEQPPEEYTEDEKT